MSLGSGLEELRRYLKPLDSAEVEQFLTHKSSPFRLPPLDGRSWKDQNQALQYIIFHIGGVFRTLAQFHKSLTDRLASGKRNKATKEDVEHAIGKVELLALDRMRVEWNRLELEERGRAEESMQELLFSHNPSLSLPWYDAGFVYKDNKLDQLRFVNWVAFQAATKHYLQLIPPPLGGDVQQVRMNAIANYFHSYF